MKSNKAYALVPAVLPAAERSEAERSEAEGSGAAGKTAADPCATPHPDPEVVAKPKRRIFTAAYKQRLLAEADKAKKGPFDRSRNTFARSRRPGFHPHRW